MDPYLEHPVLWEAVHTRLIIALANQLQPRLDPRYIATIEVRVFVEGPQHRVLEVEELTLHQKRVEILDSYNEMRLVAIIEVLSPTNKRSGPGRDSYLAKQSEILNRDCHLIEIDLLRLGQHVLSVPDWRVQELRPYDYLTCVNRWPARHRFHLYPTRMRYRLPRILVPLIEGDADVALDIQSAVEDVHRDGRYTRRLRYDEACVPALSQEDQEWATERVRQARTTGNGEAAQTL